MQSKQRTITKNRVFGIAVIGVIMFFALACEGEFGESHGPDETFEEVLSVGEMPTLIINGENGDIKVEAGEENEVRIQATLRRPDDVEFAVTRNGDEITITAKSRESFFGLHGSPGAEIGITVPPRTRVDIRTSNGSIQVEGLRESGTLRTSNGKIILSDVRGTFEARTSNGSIEFEGELVPGGNNELRTSNGSVTVELLGEPNVRLDATTSNGKVSTSQPITTTSMDENHILGTIGDGDAKLVVRTSNGSVTIR